MEKKGQIAVGLIAIIAIAAIGGGIAIVLMTPGPGAEEVTLIYGTAEGAGDLDPQYAWDSSSIDVIDQVFDGLFAYDLTDPDLAIVPGLATLGVWNPAADEFILTLRQGVKFHDGADFNADAVNFTWDRLNFLINISGTNDVEVTQIAGLYQFPDGTPIVSSITKNSEFSVTFNLARPFIPFKALLCFSGSYMMSPDSTPAEAYIDTATGDIVGTGAFVYDGQEAGVETLFHAYADYWQGASEIDKLVFSLINDASARNAALLSGDVHYLSDPMDAIMQVFNYTDGITLEYVGQGLVTQYLGMNNRLINNTWREVIATALDYDYILNVLRDGNAIRLESPIPIGISMANWSHQEDVFNVSYARTLVQGMGYGAGLNISDDTDWVGETFMTLNYTYNIGNSFREDMLVLLQDNLGKVGIVVTDAGMIWDEFVWRLNGAKGRVRDNLQLFWVGWGPDYNDPGNFIDPLFTNSTGPSSNGAQYNGYTAAIEAGRDPMLLWDNVQLLMEAGLEETDPVAREAIYDRIQYLLVEEDRPWAWGYASLANVAYVSTLHGIPTNAMGSENFYTCYFD
ncbi:MAG: ABC transporter substrate-binding protein [Promethearchaeota archaeon]